MPLIETVRGSFYVADYRKGDDRLPILLVHGAGGSFMEWPASLRRHPDLNAIAIDLAGHGLSPLPGRMRIEDYTADIIAILDALSLEKVVLAGHSMGGAIVQMVALMFPERVDRLILVGTGSRIKVNETILTGIMADPETTASLVTKWSWAKGTPENILQLATKALLKTPLQVIHDDYKACDAFDVTERLGEINIPTLVLCGTQDKMTPLSLSEALAHAIPNATLIRIEGGGHMVALEKPDEVVSHIKNWLLADVL